MKVNSQLDYSKNILEKIKKIEQIKSDQDLAKLFNVTKYAVYNWKARNSIPEDKLKNYCLSRGLNYGEFVGIVSSATVREPAPDYKHPIESKFPGLMDYLAYHPSDFDYLISKHKISSRIETLEKENTEEARQHLIWKTLFFELLDHQDQLIAILEEQFPRIKSNPDYQKYKDEYTRLLKKGFTELNQK
jgi:hypothetical protein